MTRGNATGLDDQVCAFPPCEIIFQPVQPSQRYCSRSHGSQHSAFRSAWRHIRPLLERYHVYGEVLDQVERDLRNGPHGG